ncbi:hypothetical protein F383_32448 [Gossypium arboreum]|uniref:Uncharacterized protein n=1 Tax=Gossypium arboreum TaxID=29729 RepID=A0A0B0PLA7_GOSAR|nr:hypothetical protein F383_32448 [Gossypium arboreum]
MRHPRKYRQSFDVRKVVI